MLSPALGPPSSFAAEFADTLSGSSGQSPTVRALGTSRRVRIFLRRRLSEFRDNWLSKNQGVLKAAKAFQRHFSKV